MLFINHVIAIAMYFTLSCASVIELNIFISSLQFIKNYTYSISVIARFLIFDNV